MYARLRNNTTNPWPLATLVQTCKWTKIGVRVLYNS